MNSVQPTAKEIVERGKRVYDQLVRDLLEPAHNGEIAVINLDTGEFELDRSHHTAVERAQKRWPNTVFYSVRVGFPTLGHIGARTKSKPERT